MVEEGQHIIQLEELFPFVHTITPHLFVIIVVVCIIIVDVFVEQRKNVISLLLTMTITEEEYVATKQEQEINCAILRHLDIIFYSRSVRGY